MSEQGRLMCSSRFPVRSVTDSSLVACSPSLAAVRNIEKMIGQVMPSTENGEVGSFLKMILNGRYAEDDEPFEIYISGVQNDLQFVLICS